MTLLRIATYNIHKGVQGLGPSKRLEIHNLGHAVEQFDADIVCLQEVRRHNRKLEKAFTRWPDLDQAGYLSPEGYESVYRTNAVTRHGETIIPRGDLEVVAGDHVRVLTEESRQTEVLEALDAVYEEAQVTFGPDPNAGCPQVRDMLAKIDTGPGARRAVAPALQERA